MHGEDMLCGISKVTFGIQHIAHTQKDAYFIQK